MAIKHKYLQHYLEKKCDDSLYSDQLATSSNTDIVVVIPCYKESLAIIKETLDSLSAAEKGQLEIKVLLLINYKENDSKSIQENSVKLYEELLLLTSTDPNTYISIKELKGKHKGVGMARKVLMDAAFLHFLSYSSNGLIVNLDADTLVESNYYKIIAAHFSANPHLEAASIDFTHRDLKSNPAILHYEFHLNYFIMMQRWVGLPFAYQTIGSAMCVRAFAYAKENGMNMRQAGEDFYFLHKYSKNETLGDIYDTTVYPSGRESDRIPFGTGKAVADYNRNEKEQGYTYNPQSFIILKQWLRVVLVALRDGTNYPESDQPILSAYLDSIKARIQFEKVARSSKNFDTRIKHFFTWFDAFVFFKYLHYCRDNGLENVPSAIASKALFKLQGWDMNSSDLYENLLFLRKKGREVTDYNNQWRAGLISNPSSTSAS